MSLNINLQLFSIFIGGRHAFTIEIVYKGKQGKLASETAI